MGEPIPEDLSTFFPEPDAMKRPDTPDFWRLSEISMQLKGRLQSAPKDHASQERAWRSFYEDFVDFPTLQYHALQMAFSIHGIVTGADLIAVRSNPGRAMAYIQTVQAFFDGFALGAEFVKRGGHQD